MHDWVIVTDSNQDFHLLTPEESAITKRRYDLLDPSTQAMLERRFTEEEIKTVWRKCG
jgi:hypothetical protein